MDKEEALDLTKLDDEDLFALSSDLREGIADGHKEMLPLLEGVEIERLSRRAQSYPPEASAKAEACRAAVERIKSSGLSLDTTNTVRVGG